MNRQEAINSALDAKFNPLLIDADRVAYHLIMAKGAAAEDGYDLIEWIEIDGIKKPVLVLSEKTIEAMKIWRERKR